MAPARKQERGAGRNLTSGRAYSKVISDLGAFAT